MKKEMVDLILHNATVVTMDDEYRVITNGAVAIKGDSILMVGSSSDVLASCQANETIDCQEKVLLPGLIDVHTHLPMNLLRGLADDRRLDVWLMGYMMPVEREFVSPDFSHLGTLFACAELIRSGVTCFADMYYFEDAVATAAVEAGLRGVCGQTVLKFPSPDAPSFEDALALVRELMVKWKNHPLITPAVAPHAPYTCTPEILRACTDLALEFDVPLHIHLSETKQEVDQCREQHGMPVIPWVKKQGIFEAKVIAAHCVHIDEGEIHTLKHANAGVAHNPSSNMKLASGFAPVVEMLNAQLNVGIGTDGSSSNNDLDMFEEMRLANFIAKGHSSDPTVLPARQTLALATRLAAKAIHLGDQIGSLEPGKRADLILIDIFTTHNLPHFNHDKNAIYSRLVYASKSTDISDVMVNGRWLMHNRELLTLDEDSIKKGTADYSTRIDTFLIEREGSVLSKLVAIAGAEQEESYEVQIKIPLSDPELIIDKLSAGQFEIVRTAHYIEYDTYFTFKDLSQGCLRYREDEFIDAKGEVFNVRYRLTVTGPVAEREYYNSVLLSRSRFIAPASHSLRFYREYFKPESEVEINKDRLRWLINFRDEEFFINIDRLTKPAIDGAFLEIKSRTWSRMDAERKAEIISELLKTLGIAKTKPSVTEYINLIANS